MCKEQDKPQAQAVEVEIAPSTERAYNGKLLLRVPRELHKRLAEDAAANGVSLNQWCLYLLAR